jgi:hypothetical protein
MAGMPGKTVPGSAAAGGGGARLKHMCVGGAATVGGSCQGRLCRSGNGGAAGAGLEAGGGVVVLLVAHLEREVTEAALQDDVGAVVEGRERHHVVAAMVDPDTFGGPQLLGQVLWQLPVFSSVVPGK